MIKIPKINILIILLVIFNINIKAEVSDTKCSKDVSEVENLIKSSIKLDFEQVLEILRKNKFDSNKKKLILDFIKKEMDSSKSKKFYFFKSPVDFISVSLASICLMVSYSLFKTQLVYNYLIKKKNTKFTIENRDKFCEKFQEFEQQFNYAGGTEYNRINAYANLNDDKMGEHLTGAIMSTALSAFLFYIGDQCWFAKWRNRRYIERLDSLEYLFKLIPVFDK